MPVIALTSHALAGDQEKTQAGINTAVALQRLGGDQTLYKKLLRLFHADYTDYGGRIRIALDSGNLELERRLAYSLKGVAGQLSVDAFCEAPQVLEDNIHTLDSRLLKIYLTKFDQQLKLAMLALLDRLA